MAAKEHWEYDQCGKYFGVSEKSSTILPHKQQNTSNRIVHFADAIYTGYVETKQIPQDGNAHVIDAICTEDAEIKKRDKKEKKNDAA